MRVVLLNNTRKKAEEEQSAGFTHSQCTRCRASHALRRALSALSSASVGCVLAAAFYAACLGNCQDVMRKLTRSVRAQFNRFAHAGLNLLNPFCGRQLLPRVTTKQMPGSYAV